MMEGGVWCLWLEVWLSSNGAWRRERGDSLVPVWSCRLVKSLLVLWSWDRPLNYCVVRPPGPGIPIFLFVSCHVSVTFRYKLHAAYGS
jgi:hypothetical protein